MTSRDSVRPASLFVALLLATLVVALDPVSGPAQADDTAATEFRFEGRGWGHGIGMSQYGAHGKGKAGHTHLEILGHYFQGATVDTHEIEIPLLIGIMQYVGDPIVTGHPRQASFVSTGGTSTLTFGDDEYTMEPDETWTMTTQDQACTLTGPSVSQSSTACEATFTRGPDARISVPDVSDSYARGTLHVRPAGDHPESPPRFRGFHVVVEIDMEEYLLGLAEMPDWFHPEALKTQVVAARSYAAHAALRLGEDVANSPSRRDACWCHLFDDVRNQVYRGQRTTVEWPKAVAATTHQVVAADGSVGTVQGVVQAFYSSSSGGNTENKEDVWGGQRQPYLVTVDDRWAIDPDTGNPYREWTIPVPASRIAERVGLDTVSVIRVTERNESGSARTVTFSGTKDGQDAEVTRTGGQTRSLLGLRSAYIERVFLPPFVDDDGSPFEADIAWIAEQGITTGCNPPDNDRFCPTDPVTRGQMAGFIARALGLEETSDRTFTDVDPDGTFATDINKLATAGITTGCNPPDNDRYCPTDPVTRGQMAGFIVRALGLEETSDRTFTDVDPDGTFATDINKLATAGITRGCNPPDNDRYCPTNPVTRGQMASFIARALR